MDIDTLLSSFLINFFASCSSGLLALLLGIPIGLWLDRTIQKRNRENLKQTIYRALRDETLYNTRQMMTILATYRPTGEGTGLPGGYISSSAWTAIIEGGQVGMLDDTELLRLCFALYREIDRVRFHTSRLEHLALVPGNDKTVGRNRAVLRMLVGKAAREGLEPAVGLLRLLETKLRELPSEFAGLSDLLNSWDENGLRDNPSDN